MKNNLIEFKRERDLGTIIGDTFRFIRENWREYFLTIIKIAGPFILIGAFLLVLYMSSLGRDMERFGSNSDDPVVMLDTISSIYAKAFVYLLVTGIVYLLISVTSLYFIKSYIENDGVTNFDEIRREVFRNIWKFLGLGLLVGLIVFVGAILCYLPGIYFMVVFSLATSIMAFENKSIGDTLSHCFNLIRDQWWNTFGCVFVIGVLVTILSQVFSIPAFIYSLIQAVSGNLEMDPTQIYGVMKDPVYVGLNVLANVGSFILASVTLIASVFIYYDLNEQKNLTGTFEKIDKLGQ